MLAAGGCLFFGEDKCGDDHGGRDIESETGGACVVLDHVSDSGKAADDLKTAS